MAWNKIFEKKSPFPEIKLEKTKTANILYILQEEKQQP